MIYSPSCCFKTVCLSSVEHKIRYFEDCWQSNTFGSLWLPLYEEKNTTEVNGTQNCLIANIFMFLLCSADERKAYRFWTSWGWVNDDWIVIFEWTTSIILAYVYNNTYNNSILIYYKIVTVFCACAWICFCIHTFLQRVAYLSRSDLDMEPAVLYFLWR